MQFFGPGPAEMCILNSLKHQILLIKKKKKSCQEHIFKKEEKLRTMTVK